jgi:methylglutaconyl-CoA hydratase
VGVQGARFGLTETRLGLIPATIGPHVVARMGAAMARRVFMSGRIFEADEAVTLGILARAVPGAELDAAVEAEVAPYLACAPGAVAAAKALVRRLSPGIDDAAIDASVAALVGQWAGDEAPEGVAAFFEKRKPRWANRG